MRIAWVPPVGLMWCLAFAGAAVSQTTSPPPTGAVEEPQPSGKPIFQSLKEFGSFGASAGLIRFLSDEDASKDAAARPSLQAVFRYRFSEKWVGVGEFGFGWNAYKDRGDTVLTVNSGTLGLYRHVSGVFGQDWKIGAGAGLYHWNYRYRGRSVRDPQTQLYYKATDPGVFCGMETERRLSPHVTMLAVLQTHFLFSQDKTDFPTAFGGNDSFAALRIGVNYHFSPDQGILWERKVKRTIRLTSGKAGS